MLTIYVLAILVSNGIMTKPNIEFSSMQECTQYVREYRGFLGSAAGTCDKIENGRLTCTATVMSETFWSRQTNVASNCKEYVRKEF